MVLEKVLVVEEVACWVGDRGQGEIGVEGSGEIFMEEYVDGLARDEPLAEDLDEVARVVIIQTRPDVRRGLPARESR
jgi:hypothetical protein